MNLNQLVTMKGAKLTLAGVCICFLLIHVAMFILFRVNGVFPMMYFNIFSISFYVFGIYMAYREWLKALSTAIYLEVVTHMTLAVFFVGWDSGFQITLIGMVTLLFLAEYVGRILQIDYVFALPLAGVGMVAYIGVFVVISNYPPAYTLPDSVEFWLQIGWGLTVFVIESVCLFVFVLLTFRSELRLTTQAVHDELTGLPNRYYMSDFLSKSVGKSRQQESQPWLAILDIDDFKLINDTHGHNCGDFVLRTLADVIVSSVEGVESCRWGGEEFLLVGTLAEGETMEDAYAYLDRLRVTIAEHAFWYQEVRLMLTVTIGVAEYVEGESIIEWINSADKRLYTGKNNGKDQVVM